MPVRLADPEKRPRLLFAPLRRSRTDDGEMLMSSYRTGTNAPIEV
jgi:hypothetical protein